MAYLSPWLTDEEQKKASGAPNTSGAASGVIAGPPGAGGSSATPAATPAPGTGFVNLQQYLDTNQAEGGRLAGAATKGLTDQVGAYQKDAGNVAQTGAAEIGKASGAAQVGDVKAGVMADPSAARDTAKAFLDADYGGMGGKEATDYTGDLAARQSGLKSSLGALDTSTTKDATGKPLAGSTQALLNDTYGKNGNYNEGFGLLDNFLIGGTDSGRKVVTGVKNKAADVDKAFNDTSSTLSTSEQQAKNLLANNQKAVKTAAAATKGKLLDSASSEIAQQNKGLDQREGATAASLGDLGSIDRAKADDLQALDDLLKESGDYYNGTFNPGTAKPAVDTVTPTTSDPGTHDAPPGAMPPGAGTTGDLVIGDDGQVHNAAVDPSLIVNPLPGNAAPGAAPGTVQAQVASNGSGAGAKDPLTAALDGTAAADATKDALKIPGLLGDKVQQGVAAVKGGLTTAAGNGGAGQAVNAALNNPLQQLGDKGAQTSTNAVKAAGAALGNAGVTAAQTVAGKSPLPVNPTTNLPTVSAPALKNLTNTTAATSAYDSVWNGLRSNNQTTLNAAYSQLGLKPFEADYYMKTYGVYPINYLNANGTLNAPAYNAALNASVAKVHAADAAQQAQAALAAARDNATAAVKKAAADAQAVAAKALSDAQAAAAKAASYVTSRVPPKLRF